ncbi:MAG: LemA family protein [Gemmatimonadota bacterium]|jgi:LemA protein|nr:LemA family protein [Gemmatimonadota bacterium]
MQRSIITLLLLLAATLSGCGYNRIQELDERAEELKSNVGVELTNRNNLIPNLVSTVQGASQFEQETYTRVAEARAGLDQARQRAEEAVAGGNVEQMSVADAEVARQIGTYINVAVEAYPQLRATQSFLALQDQLAESENRIAVARRDFNEAVRGYNTYIRQFPQAVTARVVGARVREPFQAPTDAEQTPTVDFSRPGS